MSPRQDCESVPRSGLVRVDSVEDRMRWARAFGVSPIVLMKAVRLVGRSVEELRKLFCPD